MWNERFLEAVLSSEIASRESHGGESRIKTARFGAARPLRSSTSPSSSVKRTVVEHLGQLDFLHAKDNVVLLGPPGTGKTHLAIALGIRACLGGQRVQFATAIEWVARLGDAKRQDSLEAELRRLSYVPLIVVDEVGYIPFDPEAANLMYRPPPFSLSRTGGSFTEDAEGPHFVGGTRGCRGGRRSDSASRGHRRRWTRDDYGTRDDTEEPDKRGA